MQEAATRQNKILLVDDEQSILNSEIRVLRKWSQKNNVQILTASSGDEALAIIGKEAESLALIVSDEKMPGISGSELLMKLQKESPELLSVILTGYSELDSVLDAIKAGVHSYLMKPVNNELFIKEIDKVYSLYLLKAENKEHNKRIRQELKWASELQKKLLYVSIPHTDRIKFNLFYHPVAEVGCGGDFYDIIKLKDNKYLLFIGDVAGHGIKAAFITTIIKQIIRGELVKEMDLEHASTSQILSSLNKSFYNFFSDENNILVTFSVNLIDCDLGKLSYSNGGHLPFFRIRGDKSSKIGKHGFALGFQENIEYSEDIVDIQKGDFLLFLTDGAIEVPGCSLNEQMDTLESLIPSMKRDDFLKELLEYFKNQFPEGLFPDDVTLISAEIF